MSPREVDGGRVTSAPAVDKTSLSPRRRHPAHPTNGIVRCAPFGALS